MNQVLVVGGSGILGSALTPRLAAAGFTIRSMNRHIPRDGDPQVEWMRGDLATGEGLREAVEGVQTVVHLASSLPKMQEIDVEGTGRLIKAAANAGVEHLVYMSIIGIDKIDFPYYHAKLAAEHQIESGSIPWSIQRAGQFPSLIDRLYSGLIRLPLIAGVPLDWRLQLIDEGEVAGRLVEIVQTGPSGRLHDIAGPQIKTSRELVRQWLKAREMKRFLVHVPMLPQLSKGFRAGLTTTPGEAYGTITWEQWLARKYGASSDTDPVKGSQPAAGGQFV